MRPTIVPLENREGADLLPPSPEAVDARPAAHVAWLIENYDAPRQLLSSSSDETDSMLEAVAAIYRSRPRRETFIEWLWRNYPPKPRSDP